MARRREAGASTVVLEGEARRSAAGAGIAHRSSTSVGQELSRRRSSAASLGGTEPYPQRAQSQPWSDDVYDVAGRLQGAACALQRAGGIAGGSPDRRADAEGDRESDRFLRQHAGDEG